jgi:hypothetical protein
MAVEAAHALLVTLDAPFLPLNEPFHPPALPPTITALRRTADVTSTPGSSGVHAPGGKEGARAAPWGVVCLAVLTQRSADKAPVVRAKALAHLASIISAHASELL